MIVYLSRLGDTEEHLALEPVAALAGESAAEAEVFGRDGIAKKVRMLRRFRVTLRARWP